MAKYRKKPVVIEASQWFHNGDHPEDDCHPISDVIDIEYSPLQVMSEGKVVRRFRRPDRDGSEQCPECGKLLRDHGWIDTLEGGHVVCPGDWIITGVRGERYPCQPDIFEQTYEPAHAPLVHYAHGVYRVTEGGANHWVMAKDEERAIALAREHSPDAEPDEEFEAEMLRPDEPLSIVVDGSSMSIQHTVDEWLNIYDYREQYLACSEF